MIVRKSKKVRYADVLLILGAFLMITLALIGQGSWQMEEQVERKLGFLDREAVDNAGQEEAERFWKAEKRECLYLWSSRDANSRILHEQMPQILHDMKVDYEEVDVDTQTLPDFAGFEKLVLGLADYTKIRDAAGKIPGWADSGGCVLIAQVPAWDDVSRWMLNVAGVDSMNYRFHATPGIRLLDDVMLAGTKRDYPLEEAYESSMEVSLWEGCTVHIVSADESRIPILWECPVGDGKIVTVNFGIYDKAYRGIYSTAYSLLGNVCVYPVINGSAFYLDDFPSLVPGGNSTYLEADYRMDIKSFYSQVWWEDTQKLGEKYGIRYTGMVIEDYSDQVEAPFTEGSGRSRFQYFGNTLLTQGGEIGFHGYNHMPLCLDGFDYMGLYDAYATWNSYEDMKASVTELDRFCRELFPREQFQVYVPPSNILSEEGRRMLKEEFPQIRAIASVYLPGGPSYAQEFEVAQDGMIETPRIISGYLLEDYERLTALSELNFHYVNAHFQHPDDVLDADRGAMLGWQVMHERLAGYMEWLYSAAPSIRNLTGSELAAAVERFYGLEVYRKETEEGLSLLLKNFQDEAWLMVRCNAWEPEGAEGGTLTHLQGNLYLLKAQDAHVFLKKKEEE